MKMLSTFAIYAVLFVLIMPAWCQQIKLTPLKASGIYEPGEKIVWDVKVSGPGAAAITSAKYRVLRGITLLDEGTVELATGSGRIETTQTDAMTYLAEVRAPGADGKEIVALGGAVIAPENIAPALPRPEDFAAFWAEKLNQLDQIPSNPQLETKPADKDGVDYAKITLDNINGSKVWGQIARPSVGTKFPAMLILQWAGVYALSKATVTQQAAAGWLALNISAHDLPIDEPNEFYQRAAATTLQNYATQGNQSRETSYMLSMILGCVRASRYLTSRPDWNGQVLVAMGTSQGGYQSLAVAGLCPQITDVAVLVPAGCEMAGSLEGRRTPWPYWDSQNVTPDNRAAVLNVSRYFDPVNFAVNIKAPVLIGVGLVDNTSVPSGVFAMSNSLSGPQEVVVLPLSDHHGTNNTQAAYYKRLGTWLNERRQSRSNNSF